MVPASTSDDDLDTEPDLIDERQHLVGQYARIPMWLIDRASPEAIKLYAHLSCRYGGMRGMWPGIDRLAAELGIGTTTLNRWIKALKDSGGLKTRRRGQGRTNVYTLVWTESGSQVEPGEVPPVEPESVPLKEPGTVDKPDRGEPDRGEVTTTDSSLRSESAQTLVGEWIEFLGKRPPGRVVGQVAKELHIMLESDKIPYGEVRAGLAEWCRKGLSPSALASVVHEVRTRHVQSRSTTNDRVRAAEDLAARYRSQEQMEITA